MVVYRIMQPPRADDDGKVAAGGQVAGWVASTDRGKRLEMA
jgi:hypothetical protein